MIKCPTVVIEDKQTPRRIPTLTAFNTGMNRPNQYNVPNIRKKIKWDTEICQILLPSDNSSGKLRVSYAIQTIKAALIKTMIDTGIKN
jgi:hypothetical protein